MSQVSDLRGAVGYLGHRAREAAIWPDVLRRRARLAARPSVVFLPSSTREGASLLRAWSIAKTLQQRGWDAITLPAQLELVQRNRLLRAIRPDLIVFQQCRHLLNDPALTQGYRHVLDIDDADFHDPAMEPRLIRTSQTAAGIIAGSRYIKSWCDQHNQAVQIVWTGTPVTPGPRPAHATRPSVVAWAQSAPLGYHMELDFVVDLDHRLRAAGSDHVMRLYGVNSPAEQHALQNRFGAGARLDLRPTLDYGAFLRSLRDVAVGLSPIIAQSPFSRGKSFGKILGYLDAAVPVVASDEADHALFFDAGSGVISNDILVWQTQILRLLADPGARDAMAERATKAMTAQLTTAAAAEQVDGFLRRLL
jgi:hypothetical protein